MKDATELLNLPVLDRWLKSRITGLEGDPQVRQFGGGASNLTFALSYANRTLIVRRPPPGRKAAGAHDMAREYRVLAALKPHFDRVPQVFACCEDEAVMGAPFFVMERLDGVILRGDLPPGMTLDPMQAGALCEAMVATWAALHAVDLTASGLTALDRGDGYVKRQVSGWTRRYRDARTPDAGDFEAVMAWLDERQPDDQPHCLIHNDYRLDNLVLDRHDPTRIVGVLDWELATVGDPLMDVGAAMAYWIQADDEPGFHLIRRQPSHLAGMYSREQIVERYGARSGRTIRDFRFYEVYGLFRLAGIAQQIYYRHYHGQFQDDRFAGFIEAVNYLEQRCLRIIGDVD